MPDDVLINIIAKVFDLVIWYTDPEDIDDYASDQIINNIIFVRELEESYATN